MSSGILPSPLSQFEVCLKMSPEETRDAEFMFHESLSPETTPQN